MNRSHTKLRAAGFVLLEAILAVAIFSLGVLTLGRCVSNCLSAQHYRDEDALARLALENRFAAIQSGAIRTDRELNETLEGTFAGLKLHQTSTALKKQNEKKEEITDMVIMRVEVSWLSGGEKQSKEINFYAQSNKR